MGQVDVGRGLHQQGAHRLGVGLGRQQHPAHVGVLDDRHLRGIGILHFLPGTALEALFGVRSGGLLCRTRGCTALQTDLDTGGVHHVEHEFHALALLAEEDPAAAIVGAEDEGAGGRSVDPHLVLDVVAVDVVRLTQRAVLVDPDLGYHEQRQPPGPDRRVRSAGEHQVDDVVSQVLLAGGDEDLLAADLVDLVSELDGLGLGGADVGARLGLGQAHRPAPLTGVELGDEARLLVVGAEVLDHRPDASSQHQGQRQRYVGPGVELVHHCADDVRQTHSAEVGAGEQSDPATLAQGVEDRLERLRHGHDAVLPLRADPVAVHVGRGHLLLRDLERLVDDHLHVLTVPVGESLRLQQLLRREPLEQLELHVTQVDFVVQGRPPSRVSAGR